MHTLEQLRSGALAGIRRLDLSCGLQTLPPEVFDLADTLEVLNLTGNQLQQLLQVGRLLPPLARAAYSSARTAWAQRGQTPKGAPGRRFKLAPATPFNTAITNQRAFAGVSLPLGEVKAIGKALNCSVNDVLLSCVAGAIGEYLKAHGDDIRGKEIRAMVPVNLRPVEQAYKLGNRSALEWVLDQYKEKKPKDPTIREKFNTYRFADYKEQVIDLLRRVCAVSVGTMEVVRGMEKAK